MRAKLGKNGALLSLISTLLFATQFPLIRLGLNHLTAHLAAIYEAVFTVGFCLGSSLLLRQRPRVVFSWGMLASGLLNALGLVFLFESLSRIHPGLVGLIGRLYFVFAMLIAYLYFRERPNRLEVLLIFVAISGVFFVSLQKGGGSMNGVVGLVFAVLYPACFALQNAVVKSMVKRASPITTLLNTKLYALAPLVLYALLKEGGAALRYSPEGAAIILCSTFLATFLGLTLFYRAMAITTFGVANLMKAAEPVFVLLLSAFMFPIQLSTRLVLGMALILVPVGVVPFVRSRPDSTKA